MGTWKSTTTQPSARSAESPSAAATGSSLAATRAAKRRPNCGASWLPASGPQRSRSPGSKTYCHESLLIQSTASRNSSRITGRPLKLNSRLGHLIEPVAPVILSRLHLAGRHERDADLLRLTGPPASNADSTSFRTDNLVVITHKTHRRVVDRCSFVVGLRSAVDP